MSKLSHKFLLAYIALILLCFALAAASVRLVTRRGYVARSAKRLELALAARKDRFAQAHLRGDRIALDVLCHEVNSEFDGRVSLISRGGDIVADSMSARCLARARPECRPAIRARKEEALQQYLPLEDTITIRLPMQLGREPVTVRLALPIAPLNKQFRGITTMLLCTTVIGIAAAVALGYVLARRIAAPIERMTEAAERIAAGDFECRAHAPGNDEIHRLAEAFNRMRNSLKHTMQSLTGERNQALAIVANMPEGVVAVDRNERVLFANNSSRTLLATEPMEEGAELGSVQLPEAVLSALHRAVNRGEPATLEVGNVHRDEHVLCVTITPICLDDAASPQGAVMLISDVTATRRVQNLSRELVANASHELRTPLAIAGSAADTLLADACAVPAESREFVEIISRQLHRMEDLVRETLQLSQLEAGRPEEISETFDLNPIVADVCAQHRDHAARRGLRLKLVPAPEPVPVEGLARCVSMAVANLVDNALRYSDPHGRVRVRVETEEKTWAAISVEDDGPGIPSADRERIFERFVRGKNAAAGGPSGSGLGLAIVAKVAELHRGTVAAESKPGGGSRFVFRIPLAETISPPDAPRTSPGDEPCASENPSNP